MPFVLKRWRAKDLCAVLLSAGLSVAVVGCHSRKEAPTLNQTGAASSAALADNAAAVISAVCTRQSYATARVGLIAGATGLREDVFELRDPVSYKIVPYRLGATVELERLLRQSADVPGRPSAQADCMRQFANYFDSLAVPLVDAAQDEKNIDIAAFRQAQKEAQQEIQTQEQNLRQ
jgi:hypothetical protein